MLRNDLIEYLSCVRQLIDMHPMDTTESRLENLRRLDAIRSQYKQEEETHHWLECIEETAATQGSMLDLIYAIERIITYHLED